MIAEKPIVLRQLRDMIYNGYEPGFFGLLSETAAIWDLCRETFHERYTWGYLQDKWLYKIGCVRVPADLGGGLSHRHPSVALEDFAAFFAKLEALLGIKESVFHRVQADQKKAFRDEPEMVCIEPNAWWLQESMRLQFFSCAMRAAHNYLRDVNNFFQSMFRQEYFKTTSSAVCRFLDGYTHYVGRPLGWHSAFAGASDSAINSLLVKPV